MNDEQVGREIDEIRNVQRNEALHAVAVFALLAVGAVLLTVGVATYALLAWLLGAVAFVLAVLVDELHNRTHR